jgi:hypothetical protein
MGLRFAFSLGVRASARTKSVVCSSRSPQGYLGGLLAFKSSRPTYSIILLALSSLWMCAVFLPLLYSIVLPNAGLQGVIYALEERGTAPPEAVSIVQETMATAGPVIRAIRVGYYSGVTATVRVSGSNTSEKVKQASYLAWFQQRPKPILVAITCYESSGDQKAYGISEVDPAVLIRGYSLPILLFGVSLFLVCRKPPSSAL